MKQIGPKASERCQPLDGKYLTLNNAKVSTMMKPKKISGLEKLGLFFIGLMLLGFASMVLS